MEKQTEELINSLTDRAELIAQTLHDSRESELFGRWREVISIFRNCAGELRRLADNQLPIWESIEAAEMKSDERDAQTIAKLAATVGNHPPAGDYLRLAASWIKQRDKEIQTLRAQLATHHNFGVFTATLGGPQPAPQIPRRVNCACTVDFFLDGYSGGIGCNRSQLRMQEESILGSGAVQVSQVLYSRVGRETDGEPLGFYHDARTPTPEPLQPPRGASLDDLQLEMVSLINALRDDLHAGLQHNRAMLEQTTRIADACAMMALDTGGMRTSSGYEVLRAVVNAKAPKGV